MGLPEWIQLVQATGGSVSTILLGIAVYVLWGKLNDVMTYARERDQKMWEMFSELKHGHSQLTSSLRETEHRIIQQLYQVAGRQVEEMLDGDYHKKR